MKKLILILIAVGVIALAAYYVLTRQSDEEVVPVAVEVDTTKSYSTDEFSVEYPSKYAMSVDEFGTVTISNEKGKIAIGGDNPSLGAAPIVEAELTPEQRDELPKDIAYHGYEGSIGSGLFYKTGDEETAAELKKIQDSIELK